MQKIAFRSHLTSSSKQLEMTAFSCLSAVNKALGFTNPPGHNEVKWPCDIGVDLPPVNTGTIPDFTQLLNCLCLFFKSKDGWNHLTVKSIYKRNSSRRVQKVQKKILKWKKYTLAFWCYATVNCISFPLKEKNKGTVIIVFPITAS